MTMFQLRGHALSSSSWPKNRLPKKEHAPYSPDFSPNDVWLFTEVKSALKKRRFQGTEGIKNVKMSLKLFQSSSSKNIFSGGSIVELSAWLHMGINIRVISLNKLGLYRYASNKIIRGTLWLHLIHETKENKSFAIRGRSEASTNEEGIRNEIRVVKATGTLEKSVLRCSLGIPKWHQE
jgi:hypothetical protein